MPGMRRRFQMTCGHILKSFLGTPKLPQSRLKLNVFALIDGHYEVATPPSIFPTLVISLSAREVLALQATSFCRPTTVPLFNFFVSFAFICSFLDFSCCRLRGTLDLNLTAVDNPHCCFG